MIIAVNSIPLTAICTSGDEDNALAAPEFYASVLLNPAISVI